ncbi:hypothetical protein FA15DRAFT_435174 [Coprinopsis marcescibilis]|uniref:Uncharacterized protein n=1 Tax=Coprinopsis marcescibilis TaxID=230819 RepID=A0A5C3K8X8_COPMA|nr:hypothetical protein FA15DRAFT_435174 [Coprinopsis marcescibilis]
MYKSPQRMPLAQHFAAIFSSFPSLLHRCSLAAYGIVFILFDRFCTAVPRKMKPGSLFSVLIHLRVSHTPYYILQKLDNETQDCSVGGRVSRRADAVGGFRQCGRLDSGRLWLPGPACAHARVHRLNRLPAALCASFHVPVRPARRLSSCPSLMALFGRCNVKRSHHPASRVLEDRP